jgi:hypothetical protein
MSLRSSAIGYVLIVSFSLPVGAQQPVSGEQQRSSSPSAVQQSSPAPGISQQSTSAPDPKEIVRRAVETDHRTMDIARSYTCQLRQVIRYLGKNHEVKSTEVKTYDINFYYGQEYSRLVQVDDKPLSDKEQKKEDEKLDKFLAKYKGESEDDREKRLEKERRQREDGRAFVHDVVNAYDFRLVGDEKVDGVEAWVIEATPRADFHPTQKHADMLKKIKGRMWIEKKDYNWVKVAAEATDTISFGFFLFRIHPGSRFVLEKMLVNNEVWLLRRLDIDGGARIALFKNENIEQEDVTSNFKKFVTSVRILPDIKEVEQAPK